jgi:hypothetical protein
MNPPLFFPWERGHLARVPVPSLRDEGGFQPGDVVGLSRDDSSVADATENDWWATVIRGLKPTAKFRCRYAAKIPWVETHRG